MNTNEQTILIIDDDEELCENISTYLSRHAFQTKTALRPSLAYEIILKKKPDLILLDIMMPEQDGFEVCKELVRHQDKYGYTPIIMLTARGDVFDRVVGLEIGANDYLPKPFEPRELLARIRSTLRHAEITTKDNIDDKSENFVFIKGLTLIQKSQTVWLDGEKLVLTAMEYELLALFYSQPDTIISRDQIMDHLRGTDASIYSRAIDTLVKRLRQKLQDESHKPRFIKTAWGRGYQMLSSDLNKNV